MAEHRIVSVRGVSERNVPADLPSWAVDFSHQGTDFASIQQSIDAQARAVRAYFQCAGFRLDEISDSDVSVSREQPRDKDAHPVGPLRLTIRRTIELRTGNVMRFRAAYSAQSELLREGVEVSGTNASYTFTWLNALKPQMIAEATRKNGGDQAIGRSRGGLTIKIHALVDALGNPVAFSLTLGQASDLSQAELLLSKCRSAGLPR